MLNSISLMGRFTRDPEYKKTPNGTSVVSFTLAVDRDYSNGESKTTDFIDCIAWRNTADFIAKYFRRGSMAIVNGSLQVRSWTDNENNKRKHAEVLVGNIYFGESKKREDQPETPHRDIAELAQFNEVTISSSNETFIEVQEDDGDLPF